MVLVQLSIFEFLLWVHWRPILLWVSLLSIGTHAVYTVVVGVVVVRHLSRGKCPFFCRRVLLIQRSASLRGQMIFGASCHLHSTKLGWARLIKSCRVLRQFFLVTSGRPNNSRNYPFYLSVSLWSVQCKGYQNCQLFPQHRIERLFCLVYLGNR